VSLTSGKGPLSRRREGRFSQPVPDDLVYVEPFRRRVRGLQGERTVVDSEQARLVHRPGSAPVWAFPEEDVDGVESVPTAEAPGHVEVEWAAVDQWFQEQEEVRLHAPNPYHRVEYLRTDRHLRVTVAGEVLVDTSDTIAAYETALEPRLYVALEHVRTDLLTPSPTTTYCPYKGTASYWNAEVGGTEVPDVAWSYEDPTPEATPIARHLSFDVNVAEVTDELPAARAF
jgi:uncharacterized protein (DUF427 family)